MTKTNETIKLELDFPTYLKEIFDTWAKGKLKVKVINNYRTWMNQLPNYIRDEFKSFPNDFQKEIRRVKFLDDYLVMIDAFVREGDRLYALSVYDKIYEIVKLAKDISKGTDKTNWSNRHSAFVALGDFLFEWDFTPIEDVDKINEMRSCVPKNSLRKIDGMDSLLSLVSEKKFIEMAIEGSYFFKPAVVNKQFVNWNNAVARHTTDSTINIEKAEKPKREKDKKKVRYVIDNNNYEVYIDPDNNRYVRDLIKDTTGVTVASGKNALIQNTIISHVWGQAYDPRYFTSLWNIVLIPAWANSLMDKEEATPGSLASKMRATYMAICTDLYRSNFVPSNFGLNAFPSIKHQNDIISATYTINVIEEKQNEAVVIKRTKQTV